MADKITSKQDVDAAIGDCERFLALLREDACPLYAHALREAANSAFYIINEQSQISDG